MSATTNETSPTLNVELLDRVYEHIATLPAWRHTSPKSAPVLVDATGHVVTEAVDAVWDQGDWRDVIPTPAEKCATAMCFAGWTCELTGGKWASSTPDTNWTDRLLFEPGDDVNYARRAGDSDEVDAEGVVAGALYVSARLRAKRLLGLNEDETNALFGCATDLALLRTTIDDIIGGHWRTGEEA